jgi:hypothetical protein
MKPKSNVFYLNVVLDTRRIYVRVLDALEALSGNDIDSKVVLECTFRAWSISTNSIIDQNCNGYISPVDAIMISVADLLGVTPLNHEVECETKFTKLCELCHSIYLDLAPQLDDAWFLVNEIMDVRVKSFVGPDMVIEIQYF